MDQLCAVNGDRSKNARKPEHQPPNFLPILPCQIGRELVPVRDTESRVESRQSAGGATEPQVHQPQMGAPHRGLTTSQRREAHVTMP